MIDLSRFQRQGQKSGQSKTVRWKQGTEGYRIVAELEAQNIDVPEFLTVLMKDALNREDD